MDATPIPSIPATGAAGPLVRAYPLPGRCWWIDRLPDDRRLDDEDTPHFATEDEALTEAAEWVEDDQAIPVVAQLRAPCWVAVCTGCGADMEDSEYGPNLHYPTGAAVDADAADLSCVDGCRPPDHDRRSETHLEDPASSMDPLPGLETWGAGTWGAEACGSAGPASPVVVA